MNNKRDLRSYASQTTVRAVAGALLILLLVGLGLVGLIYGWGAAIMGLLCLLGASIPIGLIFISMFGLDWLVKKIDKDNE